MRARSSISEVPKSGDVRGKAVAARPVLPTAERDRRFANTAHQRERLGARRLENRVVEQLDQ